MTFNAALFALVGLFIVALFVMEAYTAAKGIPTISERIQALGHSAPLLVVVASFLVGALLVHFFG